VRCIRETVWKKIEGDYVGGDETEVAGGGNIRESRAFAWSVTYIREAVWKKIEGDYVGGNEPETAGGGNIRETRAFAWSVRCI
jgi:hypothetical protein